MSYKLYDGYDSYGYDTSEEFASLAVQDGFVYDGEKVNKKEIKYTQQESFVSENGVKEEELLAPTCLCGTKPTLKLITDDDTINNRTTQN